MGNLTKPKCPNCKSKKLKHLEKELLNRSSKPYYNHSKYDLMNGRRYSSPDGYYEYEIYDIKYQCSDCDCIFNKTEEH